MCLPRIFTPNSTFLLKRLLSFSNLPMTSRKKKNIFFFLFSLHNNLHQQPRLVHFKDTQSCNTISVVRACQASCAMPTVASRLSPSYLADMSCCCKILTSCIRLFVYSQSLSSHLCPCTEREFYTLQREGTRKDPGWGCLDSLSPRKRCHLATQSR